MINPKNIVNLKGKMYPTWPGVLDAATEAGLKSLTTRVLQIPSPENGNMAIVAARAEFGDGRVFEDIGDASPANCTAMIASAALRMASTRAKGRCLRDAINVGETMFEELPRDDEPPPRAAPPEPESHFCEELGCGIELTRDEVLGCQKKADRLEGHLYCKQHGAEILSAQKLAAAGKPDPFEHEQ